MVLVSYMVSWISGYWNSNHEDYVVANMFGYLPFFVTGMVVPRSTVQLLQSRAARCLGLLTTCGILYVHFHLATLTSMTLARPPGQSLYEPQYSLWMSWLPMSHHPYFELVHVAKLDAFTYHTTWMQRVAIQFVVVWPSGIALLAAIPHGKMPFTELGQRTMYCYALHKLVLESHFVQLLQNAAVTSVQGCLLGICFALCLTAVLCSEFTRHLAWPIMEPRWVTYLFRKV
mmetsp:Transcript_6200/g.14823  ORF Transcript_6200/g.14823 Transcript_6200/m.14823 type:complete len:230 (+) Transcript_6200:738-1427(+)